MISALCVDNSVEVYNFADYHHLTRLKTAAERFIIDNFIAVSQQEAFLELTVETLQVILSSDDLNVAQEECVCEALLRWLDYNRNGRKEGFTRLLFCVRFPLIDINYIKNRLCNEPFFQGNVLCRELVEQVRQSEYHNNGTILPFFVTQFNSTPRIGMSFLDDKKRIIFSGGNFLTHANIISPEEIAHLMVFSENLTNGCDMKKEDIEMVIAKEWNFFHSLINRGITINEIRDFVLHIDTS